jgi:hypothetical protein
MYREPFSVLVSRSVQPVQSFYSPNSPLSVSLEYRFFQDQVGLILRESLINGMENASPAPDFLNQTLAKWLVADKVSVQNGSVNYTFLAPPLPGNYTISGEWKTVTGSGYILSGPINEMIIQVASVVLEGFVEDVLGNLLPNVTVNLNGTLALTNQNGYYLIVPAPGQHELNASKDGYLPESVTLDIQSSSVFFNFTGNYSLVPEQVSDNDMLAAVARWAGDFFGDDKLLEVVHQWAGTPG